MRPTRASSATTQRADGYLGRETPLRTGKSGMAAFFSIPANRVIELGIQIEL